MNFDPFGLNVHFLNYTILVCAKYIWYAIEIRIPLHAYQSSIVRIHPPFVWFPVEIIVVFERTARPCS